MTETNWKPARLIPTTGINGTKEQETRAASAFLAVLGAVKEFHRSLLASVGAPAGNLETYTEVRFKIGDKDWRPDGLVRVTRGSKTWTALVEVKTGKDLLKADQVGAYLDLARQEKFNAVITISNEIASAPGVHPTTVDKRKLRNVELHHWSWSYIVSNAVTQKEHRGVSDPDQAWILGELIHYLEDARSGALSFDDMGAAWVPIREQVANKTLRASEKSIPEVTGRFDALLTYAALKLGQKVGSDVAMVLSRKEQADPTIRQNTLKASLVADGTLSGAVRVKDTISDIDVTADLRANEVTTQIDVDAPKTGRPVTRVNWLIRQLKDAPGALRIEAFTANQRGSGAAALLSALRENPELLVVDPTKEIRSFRIALMTPLGQKRGSGDGTFINSVLGAIDGLYEDVVQQLKPWTAAAPKMKDVGGNLATEEEAIEAAVAEQLEEILAPADSPLPSTPPPTFEDRLRSVMSARTPDPEPDEQSW